MSEISNIQPRKPWLAAVLSLFCTGLGHIYCGRFVKGLVLFVAGMAYAPVTFWAARAEPASGVFLVLFASYFIVAFIFLYAIFDSYLIANRIKGAYSMRDYNNGLVYTLFIVLGVAFPMGALAQIRAFAFEAYYCPAASMEPGIAKGDRFLVNKRVYQHKQPQYGDVIVFRNPEDRNMRYIKRLVGLPGDRVAVTDNEVFLNGKKLGQEAAPDDVVKRQACPENCRLVYETNQKSRYLIMLDSSRNPALDYAETEVPEGHCFVMGDNRNNSKDSRIFGFVPLADVIGRGEFIYFPARSWSRFGKMDTVE